MTHFNELSTILNNHFGWHKSRMNCFVYMITALYFKQSSNLARLSNMFASAAKPSSSYRRIQRFLSEHHIDFNAVASFIFMLFKFNNVSLTLDRTNWKWGKKTLISSCLLSYTKVLQFLSFGYY
jgi:hypothetical protein